jgi:hypothetical protein
MAVFESSLVPFRNSILLVHMLLPAPMPMRGIITMKRRESENGISDKSMARSVRPKSAKKEVSVIEDVQNEGYDWLPAKWNTPSAST